MKRFSISLFSIATLVVTFYACSPSKTIGTQSESTYNENIEQNRISYTDSLKSTMAVPGQDKNTRPKPETVNVTATINTQYDVNKPLDDFMEKVSERNAENNVYQGYTVQVYTGSSREKANEAKNTVYSLLPDTNPSITFDPPNYKVKVGEYTDRIEAQTAYSKLKGNFSVVLIVPERFPVNKED